MSVNHNRSDDLTVINGIGTARQQWLKESLNIHSYADLAKLSVDELLTQLKNEGKIASRSAIESWITQAKELAQETIPSIVEEPVIELNEVRNANSSIRAEGWKPFASFVVEFQIQEVENAEKPTQTIVHFMEEDTGTSWQGIESEKLCHWIIDQIQSQARIDLSVSDFPGESGKNGEVEVGTAVKITAKQIRLFQPTDSAKPVSTIVTKRQPKLNVKADVAFKADLDFEITGENASDLVGEQINCTAQILVLDQLKDESRILVETGLNPLSEGKTSYTFSSPDALLRRGEYRLWFVITTDSPSITPEYVEIRSFIVE